MQISARIQNSKDLHNIYLKTNDNEHSINIPSKPEGFGSKANGGELLLLALATCYCNDIYREAKKRNIEVTKVEVEVNGIFGGEGEPAKEINYKSKVSAKASKKEIEELMRYTDSVAEIQNTIRGSSRVVLSDIEAEEV